MEPRGRAPSQRALRRARGARLRSQGARRRKDEHVIDLGDSRVRRKWLTRHGDRDTGRRSRGHLLVCARTRRRVLSGWLYPGPACTDYGSGVDRPTTAEMAGLDHRDCAGRRRIGGLRNGRRLAVVAMGADRPASARAARCSDQRSINQLRQSRPSSVVWRHARWAVGAAIAGSWHVRQTSYIV